jgi:TrpR-related protein YerC/YecD
MNKQHKKPRCDDMYRAILTLKTVDECKQFFDDLCTVTELQAMEQRYQVAQYLDAGLIYNDILEKTGASSATISRVNRSLQYGTGGRSCSAGSRSRRKKLRRSRRERLRRPCRMVRCADPRCGLCRVRGLL